ncbi:MAG: YebC/PmpR family DNA-binding transcriptional regulator [Patescibacteria group bacterium]|nr:YebC/PmpR family DNA-binding transcriptional regulator [Patescibacteria group bacterium]
MSGHSHAKTVKHKKDLSAKKRGQMFSKMARLISVAVREGGPNPENNSKLRMAIENARSFNMPNDNIERAIKKSSGEGEEGKLEEFIFEAYGPGNTALLIEGITDNKNRALGEVKKILNQHNGKLVKEGGIKWMFERKGSISIDLKSQAEDLQDKEKLELIVIEAGAEDIGWEEDILGVYTSVDSLENVKKILEGKGVKIESSTLEWKPKEEVPLKEKEIASCKKLFDSLDENDNIQDIYSNLKA